ncbi:MAG: hypothetical protein V4507_00305 [Verrucomicrobiota bacterium]
MKKSHILFWMGLFFSVIHAQDIGFSQLNQALELPLFQDDNLWDDDEKAVAKRLGWPEESRTDTLASYRLYAKPPVSVLGTRPYSLALYAERGLVQQLSLMFSNKGDIEEGKPNDTARTGDRREGVDIKTVRLLGASIKKDADTISERLTHLLGEPKSEGFGVGAQMERILRWDWKGHAILLAAPPKEYASIRILPVEAAENDGKVERIHKEELKEMLLVRVEKRENGDHVIQQIPMVDQGPKGYCVPATIERELRYLGIPCDLYLLAMKGGTMIGGGTSIFSMMESIKSLCSIYGRTIQSPKVEINSKNIAKYIDQGLPLLWCCFVDREHDRKIFERSIERKSVTDWSAWKSKLNEFRKPENLPKKDITAGHMRMIIGYNPETREVAISDSWGEAYKERWLTYEEAMAISQDELIVIQW